MSTKFGEIDLAQIIDNEYRSKIIEKVIDWVFIHNPQLIKPDTNQVEELKQSVVKELQEKYPNTGIKLIDK